MPVDAPTTQRGRHPSITKLLEVEDIASAPSGTPATEYIKEGEAKGVILPPQPPPKPAEPAKDEVLGRCVGWTGGCS